MITGFYLTMDKFIKNAIKLKFLYTYIFSNVQ